MLFAYNYNFLLLRTIIIREPFAGIKITFEFLSVIGSCSFHFIFGSLDSIGAVPPFDLAPPT